MNSLDKQLFPKLAKFAEKLKQWEENAASKVEACPPSANRAWGNILGPEYTEMVDWSTELDSSLTFSERVYEKLHALNSQASNHHVYHG